MSDYEIYYIAIVTFTFLIILLTLLIQKRDLLIENKRINKLVENQRKIIARNRMEWLKMGVDFDDEEDS